MGETTIADSDANKLSVQVAHLERVALVEQARRLMDWGRPSVEDRVTKLTPLATAFDNRSQMKATGPKSFTWSGGVVVVVSSSEHAERDALLKLIGSVPAIQLPILIVVKDQEGAAYYRSCDPAAKDMIVNGPVSKYMAELAGILNTLHVPPESIKREFARVLDSAHLLEYDGNLKPTRSRFPRILAPLRHKKKRSR